jgi:Xaa-Pro aminopeptidase
MAGLQQVLGHGFTHNTQSDKSDLHVDPPLFSAPPQQTESRTGHSLGEEVHGNGVHMDDYETHDERRVLPGTAFTVEPGLYFDTFGVRTEINMIYGSSDATVTGPIQAAILPLA